MPINGLVTQLRKGVLEYCVLAALRQTARYGGELVQVMRMHDGLLITEGTIYPLLSRMRADGLVDTEWREAPGGSPRRYYRLTKLGQRAVTEFIGEWSRFKNSVDSILVDKGGRSR